MRMMLIFDAANSGSDALHDAILAVAQAIGDRGYSDHERDRTWYIDDNGKTVAVPFRVGAKND